MRMALGRIFWVCALFVSSGTWAWADERMELGKRLDNRTAPSAAFCVSALAASAGLAFSIKTLEAAGRECLKGDLAFAGFLPIAAGLAALFVALPVTAARFTSFIREWEILDLLQTMQKTGVKLDAEFSAEYAARVPEGPCRVIFDRLVEAGKADEQP